MDNYNKEVEKKLLEMVREKESADKRLLLLEVFIGITSTVTLFLLIFLANFLPMADRQSLLLIAIGFVIFLAGCFFALRIEQVAGYYECQQCGHRYVPTYMAVNVAMHMGRTRFMKCPECKKYSWQKKVLKKED